MMLRRASAGVAVWWIGGAAAFAMHGAVVVAMLSGGHDRPAAAPQGIIVELPPAIVAEKPIDASPDKIVQEQAAKPQPPRPQEFAIKIPRAATGDVAPQPREPVREEAPPSEKAPAAETTAPQTQKATSGADKATYEQMLRAHIERNKRYPRAARSQGQMGTALVRFTMDRQGMVLSSRLVRSAGYDLLDKEALAVLQRSQPLPPPPPEISGATISTTVPIEFKTR